jgi:hypothetical protein
LPSIVYIIIKEREIQKGEKTMKTKENKGLTMEELKKLVELLNKAENEDIEILEGLASLINSMVTLKRLQSKN